MDDLKNLVEDPQLEEGKWVTGTQALTARFADGWHAAIRVIGRLLSTARCTRFRDVRSRPRIRRGPQYSPSTRR